MTKKIAFSSFALMGTVVYLSGLISCRGGDDATESLHAGAKTLQSEDFVGPGYGGVESCIPCHEERVKSYVKTSHFRTLRKPDAGVFEKRIEEAGGLVETRDPAFSFQVSVVDDAVIQSAHQKLASRNLDRSETVAFIMGSGRIFEGYFYWSEDELLQLPLGYSELDDSWHNCPGYANDKAVFDRGIKPRCLDCHGTWAESRGGARYAPESILPGISCERCHGPGRDHVLHHQAHPDEKEGQKIVKPAELSRDRRIDMCSQCHSEPGELLQPAFHYLPGTKLSDYLKQTSGLGSDVFVHTANQIQRLKSSVCFQGSDQLDCLSCHKTHAVEGTALKKRSLKVCAGCHEPEHCGKASELPEDLRSDCLSCHMPLRQVSDTTINTKTEDFLDFFRMTEHRIGRFDLESQIVLARHEIAHDQEQAGRARLQEVASELQELAAKKEREQHFVEAMALLREAGRLDPKFQPTRRRLKELAENEGLAAEGLQMLAEARSLAQKGALREAEIRTGAVLTLMPGQPQALTLMAEIRRQLGSPREEVEQLLRDALSVRPDHAEAKLVLIEILLEKNETLEALHMSEALVSENPQMPRAFERLAQARAATGDLKGSLRALNQSLEVDANQAVLQLNRVALNLELGELEAARSELFDLIEGKDPELVMAAIEMLIRMGDVEIAETRCEMMLDRREVADRARLVLAELALQAKDWEQASRLIEPLRASIETARLLAVEAGIARLRGQFQQAEATLKRALSLQDPGGKVSLEILRILAARRVRDPQEIVSLVERILSSELRQAPLSLIEVAELAFSTGAKDASHLALTALKSRPEWSQSKSLQERSKALEARLDAAGAKE